MHDTVIQGCAGLSTLLEAICSVQQEDAGRTKELLEHARVQARLTLDEARQAVWDLRHTQLSGDVAATLHDFARHLSAEKGIPIEVQISGGPPIVQERILRTILLIAREAIRNAANHAAPRQIRLHVSFEAGEIRLEVVDNGRGFSTSTEFAERKGHYGIVGMRERVEQLGGEFRLQSTPGSGTSVVARLPVATTRLRPESVPSHT
jgi:signal transduction histidine kinase